MIHQVQEKIDSFDNKFSSKEQIPKRFTISFREVDLNKKGKVRVIINGNKQLGDTINDNGYKEDFYRYHDIFHYSFATLLGWSPCARAMMQRKRKSNKAVDEIEDGARAAITEEALSMIIFNEAKRKNYFKNSKKISKTTLRLIKEMTENFEVNIRTIKEWEVAILEAYKIFRLLIRNQGGLVKFDCIERKITYSANDK